MSIMELRNRRNAGPTEIEQGVKLYVTAAFVKVTTVRLIISAHTEPGDLETYRLALSVGQQIVAGSHLVIKFGS